LLDLHRKTLSYSVKETLLAPLLNLSHDISRMKPSMLISFLISGNMTANQILLTYEKEYYETSI